jgi:D,D-heptose 1,7-bisphosphate phosphatase
MNTPPATIRQCAILAGELSHLAADTPMPLPQVGGRPFIGWLMREMVRFGVEEFVILAGPLPQSVEDAVRTVADGLPRRVNVRFSEAPPAAGSGGALFHAAPMLEKHFLVCNGSSLFNGNIAALLADFARDPENLPARMVVREIPDATHYATVTVDDGRVSELRAGPAPEEAGKPGLTNAGIYAMRRSLLGRLSGSCSLEAHLLTPLAHAGLLRATRQHGWFADISIPDDLDHARRELAACLNRPALFLDRDGVLNHDHGYVGTQDRWEWMDGAREAVALATAHGWHVFVVTNQAGVARGLYGEPEVDALQRWVADELRRAGGTLDDWRYCPYHTEGRVDAYRRDSDWRKPAPGMLNDLMRVWEIDPKRCVMVGDKDSDIRAGQAAGMRTALFSGGNLRDFVAPLIGQ